MKKGIETDMFPVINVTGLTGGKHLHDRITSSLKLEVWGRNTSLTPPRVYWNVRAKPGK